MEEEEEEEEAKEEPEGPEKKRKRWKRERSTRRPGLSRDPQPREVSGSKGIQKDDA